INPNLYPMDGHLHHQQHNMSGIFSQVNYTSGGMYASVAHPCEGGGDKVFSQWIVVKTRDFLMNHNQHRFMNNQGVNTDTGGVDRVFAQQCVVDTCDFSMA
ncbi:hypothetical protein EJD97_003908, partial [Solanum chilense]